MAEIPDGWHAEPAGMRLEGRGRISTDGSEGSIEMHPVAAVYRVTLDEDAVPPMHKRVPDRSDT